MNIGEWALDQVHHTDALALLKGLPDDCVHCAVTSPPYYSLRDYGTAGQIGLEPTVDEYVAALVTVFRELRRVLRDDATFWLNLGDSYSSGGRGTHSEHSAFLGANQATAQALGPKRTPGFGEKQLLMVPARVALALQADGWVLRSECIWEKPNCMPASVQDRPTTSHEYVFLLAKTTRYYYDHEAVKEPVVEGSDAEYRKQLRAGKDYDTKAPYQSNTLYSGGKQAALGKRTYTGFNARWDARAEPLTKRNKRSVWTIPTQPYDGAHFAVMPEALVEPCILAGCPEGGVVLDPFGGAATVGVVAKRLNRRYLLSEINAAYVELARDRLAGVTPMLAGFA